MITYVGVVSVRVIFQIQTLNLYLKLNNRFLIALHKVSFVRNDGSRKHRLKHFYVIPMKMGISSLNASNWMRLHVS